MVGDGSCSKVVFREVLLKGKGRKRYKEPMLNVVKNGIKGI
jgi:hypothetical protein